MPWEITVDNAGILSVHAALLPTGNIGQVLLMGGDEHNSAQAGDDDNPANPADVDNTRLYDVETSPSSNSVTTLGSPTTDLFCSGHAFLGDGRLLIGGGTEAWESGAGAGGHNEHTLGGFGGHKACWVYNYKSMSWLQVADLTYLNSAGPGPSDRQGGGRWYPTLLTLPNGDVIAFSGHPSRTSPNWHNNNIPERYYASGNYWQRLKPIGTASTSGQNDYYPRVHLIKGGNIFISRLGNSSWMYNPNTGDLDIEMNGPGGTDYAQWHYSSIMLPLLPGENHESRILITNDAISKLITLDFSGGNVPSWQNTSRTGLAASQRRRFACTCYLPDGRIFVHGGIDGGSNDSNAVLTPEIFDPQINWTTRTFSGSGSWSTVNEATTVPRNYHSVLLLLPDGSILSSGSSKGAGAGPPSTTAEMRIEVYKPSYFSNTNRPEISSSPKSLGYTSSTFNLTISNSQASDIRQVALVRAGSVTHAGDFDQRYVACEFTTEGTTQLNVSFPNDPTVLPPGYYMIWIVDNAGLPCKVAPFLRVAHQHCFIYTDKSTFSIHEVDSLNPSPASPASFPLSFYAVFDGFLRPELTGTPNVTFHFDSPNGAEVPGMVEFLRNTQLENPSAGDEIAQRHTYTFDLRFTNNTAFDGFTESRNAFVKVSIGNHSCTAAIQLWKQPNPYMRDGETSWLSTDVRVFQMTEGQRRAGIDQGSNPNVFIQQLLTNFDGQINDEFHPFLDITINQENSKLELAKQIGGNDIYNYAVAKVRYRGGTVPAENVKVFFRLFNTAGTAMRYNPTGAYARANVGNAATPLLGYIGGELTSIPFFASERENYQTQQLSAQTDTPNRKTLQELPGGQERIGYFGCWLDINQTELIFPDTVTGNGPFPSPTKSIQQKIKGAHQCLVAEVFFEPDPANPVAANQPSKMIPFLATPGSSDKLSQRNLVIEESDNPGSPDSHRVQTTFIIKPSDLLNHNIGLVAFDNNLSQFKGIKRGYAIDELVLHWNNLPRDSQIELYLPEIDADEIIELFPLSRISEGRIKKIDENTISLNPSDITYIPIPGGRIKTIIGLMTILLPDNVVAGQEFEFLVRQTDSFRRVVGSFAFKIPVKHANQILASEKRKLSVMKYIAQSISVDDRWYPIFNKYLDNSNSKVRGLGGNPDNIAPSPLGDGKEYKPICPPKYLCLLATIIAASVTALGVLNYKIGFIIASVSLVLVLCLLGWLRQKCQPTTCHLLKYILLGLAAGSIFIAILLLSGLGDTRTVFILSGVVIILGCLLLIQHYRKCNEC